MFRFIKKLFGKKKPNKFAIPAAVKARAIPEKRVAYSAIIHERAGDYCNGCKKHISECPILKRKL